jgi:hypothetical protein
MKRIFPCVLATVALAGTLFSSSSFAWERGWGWGGVGFLTGAMVGAELANPYRYYGYPYYPAPVVYSAPPVVIQQQPASVVYSSAAAPVQMAAPPAARMTPPPQSASARNEWYYCESAKGYYPYVKQCPEPWHAVPASPPGPAH